MTDRLIFETGSATHVGVVRQRNEDSFLTRPEVGVWAVADGMGGHEAGDFASQTVIAALESIKAQGSAAELLSACEASVADANRRLTEFRSARGGIIAGATVAVLLIYQDHYACVWSGDSRIYLIRGADITQLSHDHTELEELLERGLITPEAAKHWPGQNAITRAIGVADEAELEVISGPIEAGDSFLICSDGLTRHVTDQEILQLIDANVPQQACDRLIDLTLERGAVDNVTVIVTRYQPAAPTNDSGGPAPDAEHNA
jgi:protein phosphatase